MNLGMARNFTSSFLSAQIAEAAYYCPQRPSSRRGWEIVCAGREKCRPDYAISRRSFPWRAVELVVHGEGWVEVKGRRFRLKTGVLFSYGPRTAYRMATDPDRPLLKYFIDFTGAEAVRLLAAGPLRPGRVRQALYPQELREILDHILAEGARHSPAIANTYLRLLLQKLHECAPDSPERDASRALGSYLRAKALLDENYLRLTMAEAAAKELRTTPETLCRLFQRFSTTSPYRYLAQLKARRAVDLLLGTDALVKEVGAAVGLDDPFQFSRLFKRVQGTSPEMFRQLYRRN